MPAIPDLRRKYDLLLAHSSFGDWTALADQFGRSPKTIRGWATDDRGRGAGFVPADAEAILIRLFAEMLPDTPVERVRHLVSGPAAHLDEEIRVGAAALISTLVRDAIRGQARLIRHPEESGLVEIEEPEGDNRKVPILALGEWFRIEFPARHDCPYGLALQQAGAIWGIATPALGRDGRSFLLPGLRGDTPIHIRERTQPGLHRFLCMQSPVPFPAAIAAYGREPVIIDKRGLELVASFHAGLPAARRACHLLEVRIEAAVPG